MSPQSIDHSIWSRGSCPGDFRPTRASWMIFVETRIGDLAITEDIHVGKAGKEEERRKQYDILLTRANQLQVIGLIGDRPMAKGAYNFPLLQKEHARHRSEERRVGKECRGRASWWD